MCYNLEFYKNFVFDFNLNLLAADASVQCGEI